jgi:hypothetical protein
VPKGPKNNVAEAGYDADREIWEKQSTETNIAYKAFCAYLEQGMNGSKRSLRRLSSSGATESDVQTLETWSSHNAWQERVAAFDLHLIEQKNLETRKAQEEAFKRIGNHSLLLYKMAQDMLKNANARKMSFKDAKEFLRLAVDLDMIANHITPQDIDRQTKQQIRMQDMELASSSGSLADFIISSYHDAKDGEDE